MQKKSVSIPNFRKNSTILLLVLVIELLALFITIIGHADLTFTSFWLTSLYLLIIALSGAMCVGLIRDRLINRSYFFIAFSLFIVFFIPYIITEIISQLIVMQIHITRFDWLRLFNHSLIFVFVAVITLHFFSLAHIVKHQSQMEVEQRFQALQSRIQPHFLFNSLNTISELAATDAEQAENAIQDLSLLFRASLETVNKPHSLQAELDLCDRYLALEAWRLGDKLSISRNIAIETPKQWYVPKLILQPLLENAVNYGTNEYGHVSINMDLKETDKFLSIMIENEVYDHLSASNADEKKHAKSKGNGMAIDNIKQRLFVLYDDQQSFKVRQQEGRYQVILRMPKQSKPINFND